MSSATIKASVWSKLFAWRGAAEEQAEDREDAAFIEATRHEPSEPLDSVLEEIKAERELRSSANQIR